MKQEEYSCQHLLQRDRTGGTPPTGACHLPAAPLHQKQGRKEANLARPGAAAVPAGQGRWDLGCFCGGVCWIPTLWLLLSFGVHY